MLLGGLRIKKTASPYSPAQIIQWLKVIGYPNISQLTSLDNFPVNIDTLTTLTLLHTVTFPFENTQMHYASHLAKTDPEDVFQRLVVERKGATCSAEIMSSRKDRAFPRRAFISNIVRRLGPITIAFYHANYTSETLPTTFMMPLTNGVVAKPSKKLSAAASGDEPHKSVKPVQKSKTSAKQDDAPYFSSNKAQKAGNGLLAQRRATRSTSGRSASAAPNHSNVSTSAIPQASHYSPGGTFHPNYVYILDPVPAAPENSTNKTKPAKPARPAETVIEVPGVISRTRREDHDPNEPVGGNNPYWSGDEIDQGEIEGFDLGDVGYGTETRKLSFLWGTEQEEEDSGDDSSQQPATGLLADASREGIQQISAGLPSRVVADGAGPGKAGSSSRKASEGGKTTKGEGPAKDRNTVASSSKGSQESSLQEKRKESSLQAKHKESSLQAKQAKDRSDTGATSSIVPGVSTKTSGLTSHELGSANARSEVAPLGPSLMAKEGKKLGEKKAVSSWTLPLPPQVTKDVPARPFAKVFPEVPFPVLSQVATDGVMDKARDESSKEKKLKGLKFMKKLATIPEKPETAVGSMAMKAVQGMFESYEPNKFTEKTAKGAMEVAKRQMEEVRVVPGYEDRDKRPGPSSSSQASTSPARIPAAEKGKSRAFLSIPSPSSGKRSRDSQPEESSKENSDVQSSRSPKRRKSFSSTPKSAPRTALSSRQGSAIQSDRNTNRSMMEVSPASYEKFRIWEARKAQETQTEEGRNPERQLRPENDRDSRKDRHRVGKSAPSEQAGTRDRPRRVSREGRRNHRSRSVSRGRSRDTRDSMERSSSLKRSSVAEKGERREKSFEEGQVDLEGKARKGSSSFGKQRVGTLSLKEQKQSPTSLRLEKTFEVTSETVVKVQSIPIAPEWVRKQMEKGWTTYIPIGAVTNEKCERGLTEKLKPSGEMVGKLENGRLTFETAQQDTGGTYLSYEDFFSASVNFVRTIRDCYVPKGERKAGGRWALKVAERYQMFFDWLKAQPQLKAKWQVYFGYISRRMHHDTVDRSNSICEVDVFFPEILQEIRESLRDKKIDAVTSSSHHSSGYPSKRSQTHKSTHSARPRKSDYHQSQSPKGSERHRTSSPRKDRPRKRERSLSPERSDKRRSRSPKRRTFREKDSFREKEEDTLCVVCGSKNHDDRDHKGDEGPYLKRRNGKWVDATGRGVCIGYNSKTKKCRAMASS
ncbi:hypothetical protein C8J56DRAFT_1022003 [Mycena floridula]|nr:hypothetical protein C8J56DRAFT_1022003 [Mycena floridula]